MQALIERYFKLSVAATTIKTELLAGLTTFLTMAYVIIVNPNLLATAGMDINAVFVATCLAAACGCLLMGFYANYPIGLAPSMSLNAFFALVVVKQLGYAWPIALTAVFCSGALFLLLTVTGVRRWLMQLLPTSLKIGIGAGIGLFLGVIALQNINLISVVPHYAGHLAALQQLTTWLAVGGVLLIMGLTRLRVPGAILICILMLTLMGIALKITVFQGIFSLPPSIKPTLLALQWPAQLDAKLLLVIFTFAFVALFDNTGTLIAVLQHNNFTDKHGEIPRLNQALIADSSATLIGALLGTSATGSYIESSAGVRAGGKTGLTAVCVGLLFLLTLFFAPLARTVPAYATAPALLYVALLMAKNLRMLDWKNYTDALAAMITALAIPATFSIAEGICWGVISYTLLKIGSGQAHQVKFGLLILSIIFAVFLVYHHYYL